MTNTIFEFMRFLGLNRAGPILLLHLAYKTYESLSMTSAVQMTVKRLRRVTQNRRRR